MGYFLMEVIGWFLAIAFAESFWLTMGEPRLDLICILVIALILAAVPRLWKMGMKKVETLERRLEAMEEKLERISGMLEDLQKEDRL